MAHRLDQKLVDRAKAMRNEPGEPERRLWSRLRSSQLGYKFRRQAVIAPYIVDFLCPQNGLVIEVDGDTHDVDADRLRDRDLANLGFRVLRFTNDDVMRNIEGVLERIVSEAALLPGRRKITHPNPSLGREGLLV